MMGTDGLPAAHPAWLASLAASAGIALAKVGVALVLVACSASAIHALGFADRRCWALGSERAAATGPTLSFGDVLYFCATTWFTVGYGDITPVDGGLRALVVAKMAASAFVMAM